jgi:arylsulfatase A
MKDKNMEIGSSPRPQLYNLKTDLGETDNLAQKYPEKVEELAKQLKNIQTAHSK